MTAPGVRAAAREILRALLAVTPKQARHQRWQAHVRATAARTRTQAVEVLELLYVGPAASVWGDVEAIADLLFGEFELDDDEAAEVGRRVLSASRLRSLDATTRRDVAADTRRLAGGKASR